MTLSPQEFVAKWRHASLKESAAYQEHFTDLCRLLGHPTPAEADPAGKWFTFQAGAARLPSPGAAGEGSGVRAGFPCPWPPGHEPADDPRVAAIAAAARELVAKRDAWLNPAQTFEVPETSKVLQGRTLTGLYNARPAWLDLAHKKLDAAVLDAYGWPHDLSDDEILARLLVLNRARTT